MNGSAFKILLVEDDALNYLDVKLFLEKEGYEVLKHPEKTLVDNYEDAIAVCRQDIPHIAVLDICIKGDKNGLEIGRYIRENFYSPVIFLTSYDTEENLRRSGLLGAGSFVVKVGKPYELKLLRAAINILIPRAQEAAAIRKESAFFHVRETGEGMPSDAGFRKVRIRWNELKLITTIPGVKNTVTLQMLDGRKYFCRKSLTECQAELPPFFLRYCGNQIVNTRFFNGKGKGKWVYYIDRDRYEIAEVYRTEHTLALLNELKL